MLEECSLTSHKGRPSHELSLELYTCTNTCTPECGSPLLQLAIRIPSLINYYCDSSNKLTNPIDTTVDRQ